MTLADITLEESTNEEIIEYAKNIAQNHWKNKNDFDFIDPSRHYNDCLKSGNVQTLVDYEEI
jgi:hypothetical protein